MNSNHAFNSGKHIIKHTADMIGGVHPHRPVPMWGCKCSGESWGLRYFVFLFVFAIVFVFVFASFLRKVEASGILSTIKIATSNIQQKGKIRLILAKFYSNLWPQSQQILSWHNFLTLSSFKSHCQWSWLLSRSWSSSNTKVGHSDSGLTDQRKVYIEQPEQLKERRNETFFLPNISQPNLT